METDVELKGRIFQAEPARNRTSWKWIVADSFSEEVRKIADVDFGYVYFVDNGIIIVQKSFEELGIDVSNLRHAFDRTRLRPILENLIREHVKPQAHEMEEQ